MNHKLTFTILALCASASAVLADTKTVTITAAGAGFTVGPDTTVNVGDTLIVTCPADTRCAQLVVRVGLTDIKPQGTITADSWKLQSVGGAGDITVAWGSAPGAPFTKVTLASGTNNPQGAPPGEVPAAPGGPFDECPESVGERTIVVDTEGNVLASHLKTFSEEDTLTIWVTGYESRFAGLSIKKTSAFRDVTVLHIVGDPSLVTPIAKNNEQVRCRKFELSDFASGRGSFSVNNSARKTSVEIEFAVRARPNGMFTVAFIGSWLKRPSFSVRDVEGTTQIVENKGGGADGRYALMYTAFVPLHSWLGFKDPDWNQRVGLSAGVILDDPENNVLLGANLGPVNGISLTLGVHAGKVNKLDGVNAGDPLAADATVPTTTQWKTGFYLGVGLDISVATKLFFSLFSK